MKRKVILIAFAVYLVVSLNNITSDATSPQTILQKLNITNVPDKILNQNLTSTNTTEPRYVFFIEPKYAVTINAAIDGNDNQLTNNETTTSRSITFHFEKGADSTGEFFCAIDNERIRSCTSPLTLNNLTLDDHLFEISTNIIIYDGYLLPNGTVVHEPCCAVSTYPPQTFYWRIGH